MKEKCAIELIIVDYFQLIKGAYSQPERATRSLKHLARDLAIPIMVLSEIGREEDLLENNPPTLIDVIENSNFYQYGDLVILIHRDIYHPSGDKIGRQDSLRAEIIVDRNTTGGVTGSAYLDFYSQYGLFREITQDSN